MTTPLRIDLHLHSGFSPDSSTGLEELVERCQVLGLHRVALTDHNTAAGALRLRRLAPDLAIVGEEVKTTEGEIIGLYITGTIPRGVTPEVACRLIHEMGGLTYLCHPFDRRRASFRAERVVELAPSLDIIETYNPWCHPDANAAAAAMCRDLGKVAATGSDAHTAAELGHSWMEVESFTGPADLLVKLRSARHVITSQSGRGRRG